MTLMDGIGALLAAAGVGDYATDRALDPLLPPIATGGWGKGNADGYVITTYPGGPPPDSRNRWEYPRLQVRVRAKTQADALALDRAAYDVLQFGPGATKSQTLEGGWWLQDSFALQSEAQPLGADANGRWEFARNYQLTVSPPIS